jgi:hypothetical protein
VNFSAVTYSLVNGIDTLNDNLGVFKHIFRESSVDAITTYTTTATVVNSSVYLMIINNVLNLTTFYKPSIVWLTIHNSTLKHDVSSDGDSKLSSITLNANLTLTLAFTASMRPVIQVYKII